MKHAGKALSLLLVCALSFSFVPTAALAADEDWQYTENGDELTITGYTGAEYDVTVPSLLNGKSVTAIASDAFADDAITGITIPESVTAIDSDAFWECRTLESIVFTGDNPNYTSDDGIAFSSDGSVLFHYPANKSGTAYIVPEGVTTIGRCAFDHNQRLESITLTDDVTRIEDCAFWRCEILTSFHIPGSVSHIGEAVFANSGGLTGITVAAGNARFKSAGGVLFDISGELLKQYPCGKSGSSYIVPDGVTVIGGGAFRGANGLTDVTLGDSVEEIGGAAFAFCESLESVHLGSGVKNVGSVAFQRCYALQSVVIPQSTEAVGDMAFDNCESLADAYFLGDMPVFGENVFQGTAEGFTVHYHKGNAASWQAYSDHAKRAFCHVTFSTGGGSETAAQMVDDGGKAAEPPVPSKPNHDFAGWYKEAALTNAWSFDTDTVTADTVLYAKWTPQRYAISVSVNNTGYGTATGGGSLAYGAAATVRATPRAGYRFVRWLEGSTQVSASAQYSFTVSGARTLVAEFARIGTPSVSTASAGYDRVKISWPAVAGATGYEVCRTSSNGSANYGTATTTSTSLTSTGKTTGTTYYYKVRVKCVAGNTTTYGSWSTVKSVKPVPSTPSVTAASAGYASVKLTWGKVSGATEYEVMRTSSNGSANYGTAATASTSLTSTGKTTGTTYYYKVRVKCVAGNTTTYGSWSSVKSVKPVPSTPSVTAASAGYTSVKLTWGKVSGATGYEVMRTSSNGSANYGMAATASTSYTSGGKTTGATYYYKVRAYRTVNGKKVYGNYSSVKSAKPVPSTPTGVKAARASSSSIRVTWNAVAGATKYEVWRATSSGGTYTKVAETSSASYTSTGLTTGRTYYYKVRAYRTVGSAKVYGNYSSPVSAKP